MHYNISFFFLEMEFKALRKTQCLSITFLPSCPMTVEEGRKKKKNYTDQLSYLYNGEGNIAGYCIFIFNNILQNEIMVTAMDIPNHSNEMTQLEKH